ncbi:MAG: hypothetical protein P1U70_12370 [Saprospiraceae bacterium]|jgi:hypothetical protein|nr:hypothetical protein [Saprospiraceae bacterium]
MKTLIIAILTFSTSFIIAQNTVTWIGGTPGNETNWEVAKNWSNNQVPNENSVVVIKYLNSGHNAQPIVENFVEVASIEVQANAQLTIEANAELIVDGSFTYSEGISLYGGEVINKGTVHLYSLSVDVTEDYFNKIQNTGYVFMDDQLKIGEEEILSSKGQLVNRN